MVNELNLLDKTLAAFYNLIVLFNLRQSYASIASLLQVNLTLKSVKIAVIEVFVKQSSG